MSKTILITGTSTGIGKATAKLFQAKGWNVVATMRTPEKETELTELDNVLVARLDVTDKASITAAVAAGVEKFGQIDVVVNNAGYGIMGALEAFSDEQIRRQFDVNFFGVIDVMKEVLPAMRARRDGMIVNVTSIGGRVVYPSVHVYNSTKFALECLTEGMKYELKPLGIKLKIIEPGAIKTEFMNSIDPAGADIEDYRAGSQKIAEAFANILGDGASSPESVADVIYESVTDGSDRLRYLAGDDAIAAQETVKNTDSDEFINGVAANFGLW